MRSSRVFHAVDSHTEGMPTRVITGGVGVIPGATMAERRLHFIAHLDHIRRLLMNEPRGHSAMSGRDPAAAVPTRRRLRRALHRGQRMPADVRARHDRGGDGPRRDRHGRGDRAGAPSSGSTHPRGWSSPDVEVRDGRAVSVTLEMSRASPSAWTPASVSRGSARCRTRSRSAATSTRSSTSTTSACRSTGPAKDEILAAGLAIMDAINDHRAAETPDHRGPSTTCTTWSSSRRVRTPSLRGTRWRSTRAGSTVRPAALALARGWPSCTRAASCR